MPLETTDDGTKVYPPITLFSNGAKGKRTPIKPYPVKITITLINDAINISYIVESFDSPDETKAFHTYPEKTTVDLFTEYYKLKPGKTIKATGNIVAYIESKSIFNVFKTGKFTIKHLEIKINPPKKRKSRAKKK